MHEVDIAPAPLDRLLAQLTPERGERVVNYVPVAHEVFGGRVTWHVNATESGGGVAEMLQTLLAYARGVEVDHRWLVLHGTPEFFSITKRLHNVLHGSPGDGGPLGDAERQEYESVLAENLEQMLARVGPRDMVLLHDPQTAGLVPGLRKAGIKVAWRCHIGRDEPTDLTEVGWAFLEPYLADVGSTIFSRSAYPPPWVDRSRLWIIPPSLDPLSAKNVALSPAEVDATLHRAGLVLRPADHGSIEFLRRTGETGTVRPHRGLNLVGGPVPRDARVVLQVSRWDRLKDMSGVMRSFVEHLDDMHDDAHLMLVGPDVIGVADDPEGAEVLQECLALWKSLPAAAQQRTHLTALPMDDVDENAHMVNALQRHAAVVTQKSLVEGFGLTVTEPMWKGRPVVASKVGGIQDQIVTGTSGLLLDDPADLDGFAALIAPLLSDEELSRRLGTAAKERVQFHFLGDRHLIQYVDFFAELQQY